MRRGWLGRWPAVALAMALLGYSSLLVYHVTSGFEIVRDIQAKEASYRDAGHDDGSDFLRQVYPGNLGQLLLSSTRLISGAIEDREDAAEFLRDPWVLVPSLVALAGLGLSLTRQMRARTGWLVLAVAVDIFVSPALNGKYRPLLDGRFLMPMLPILFIMMGLALDWAARVIGRSTAWNRARRGRAAAGSRRRDGCAHRRDHAAGGEAD